MDRIAEAIERVTGGGSWAFLLRDGCSLYASAPADFAAYDSPVIRLVRGVHETYPEQARAIVRARIFANHELGASCRGIVKVSAKRVSRLPASSDGSQWTGATEQVRSPALEGYEAHTGHDLVSAAEARALAVALAASVHRSSGPRWESARPVGSVLVSSQGALLASAWNTNARNCTLHSEANLIRGWGRPLPEGALIYTTLKPCRMCAGLIWDATQDRARVLVEYLEDDPGRSAQGTVLDLGSEERRRASRDHKDLTADCQVHRPESAIWMASSERRVDPLPSK